MIIMLSNFILLKSADTNVLLWMDTKIYNLVLDNHFSYRKPSGSCTALILLTKSVSQVYFLRAINKYPPCPGWSTEGTNLLKW